MAASTSSTRNKKRGTVIRLSLAGLALVGIGAAATTAAWTDNVFFAAQATTETFNLQGSTDNSTWTEGNPVGAAIQVPAAAFANLTPGDSKVTTVYVKNAGTIAATLAAPTATSTGAIFSGAKPATVTVANTGSATLAPGAVASLTVTVTAPANWNGDTAYQSKTGSVAVSVLGASN